MAELNTSENKKSSVHPGRKKALRVDLTAMVDLAFLLITFFILTTTLQKPKSMDLAMPVDGPPTGAAATRTLTVLLGDDNKATWYIGEPDKPIMGPMVTTLDKQGIRKVLLEQSARIKREQKNEMIVLIKPSDQSIYGNVVGIMDELNITNNNIRAIVDISATDVAMLKKDKIYN